MVTDSPIVLRQNLHNHTVFSDGRYTPAELIKQALKAGLGGLGISDHFFTRKVFRRWNYKDWCDKLLPQYLRMVKEIKQQNDYENLRVWCGLEIDTCFERVGADLCSLPWNELNQLDYILLEYVGEMHHGGMPLERLSDLREICQVPIILAHPDPHQWQETLPIDVAFGIVRECCIALELPGGTRNPWPWSSADVSKLKTVKLTIGCDTHESIAVVGAIDKVLGFLAMHDLLDCLTDPDRLPPPYGGK